MPAHVELISPESMDLPNADINDLTNKTLGRLHEYDALAKRFMNDRKHLLRQLYENAPHVFKEDVRTQLEAEFKEEIEESKKKKSKAKKKTNTKKKSTKKKK